MNGNTWSVWLRIFARTRPWHRRLALALLASLSAAGAGTLWVSLVGPVLRSLLTQTSTTWGPWQLTHTHLVWAVPAAIVGLSLVKALAAWLHTGLMGPVSQGVLSSLREDMYEHLLRLSPRWFERHHSGELLSRLTGDVAQLEFSAGQALVSLTKDSIQILGLLLLCVWTDWRLSVVLIVILPGTIVPVTRFAKLAKKAATRSQASLGQLTLLVTEQLHNLPIVQAFQSEPQALAQFDAEQHRYLAAMKRSLAVRGAFSPTTEFLGVLGVAAAMVWGTAAVQRDLAFAEKLVTFLAAALMVYQPVKSLAQTASAISVGAGAAARIFEILDAPQEPDLPGEAPALSTSLRFEHVSLTYANGREALSDITFEVKAGHTVALVGPSGAGKSSLLSLVLRHLEPSSGVLMWDNKPLHELSRVSVRQQLAWVPQEPVLLSGTIRTTLRMGNPEATDEQLWEALRQAHAADFVRGFEKRLEYQVGERGSRLSGGQRQRLAIARAFLRAPSLLILDEPTSALDTASEREVQAGLRELMAGRTTLIVAHRLSTVRNADLIVVLDKGRVVEQGVHETLVAQGGHYSRLHFSEDDNP